MTACGQLMPSLQPVQGPHSYTIAIGMRARMPVVLSPAAAKTSEHAQHDKSCWLKTVAPVLCQHADDITLLGPG